LLGFPMSVWLFFTADELILLFFGDQWSAAVPAFQWLSLTVGIQLVLSSSGSFFQASGDTRSLFVCGIFSAVLNVSAILIGALHFRSIDAVALSLLFTFTLNFIQAYWLLYTKVFKTSSLRFFKLMLKPLLGSLLLAGCYLLLAPYIQSTSLFIGLGCKFVLYILLNELMLQFPIND